VASKVTIIRSKPTAATLTNLYDIIKKTIQDVDAYYTTEQTEALKQDPQNIFLNQERKTK
jgi:translation initiation factor 2B subunit (eIF-2B alpha/beta/delta family)